VAYYKATFPRVVGPGQDLNQGNREEVARLFPNPIKYYNKNQAKKINKNMSPTPMRGDTSCNKTHDGDIAMTPQYK